MQQQAVRSFPEAHNCISWRVLPNIVEFPLHEGCATATWPVTGFTSVSAIAMPMGHRPRHLFTVGVLAYLTAPSVLGVSACPGAVRLDPRSTTPAVRASRHYGVQRAWTGIQRQSLFVLVNGACVRLEACGRTATCETQQGLDLRKRMLPPDPGPNPLYPSRPSQCLVLRTLVGDWSAPVSGRWPRLPWLRQVRQRHAVTSGAIESSGARSVILSVE